MKRSNNSECPHLNLTLEVEEDQRYKSTMLPSLYGLFGGLFSCFFLANAAAGLLEFPRLVVEGGPLIWVFLLTSAVAIVVFTERLLHYHRVQINATEFLVGMRNNLKRDNVVEALAICDATPGPIPRLVKTAVLNREHGRERVREALEEAGLVEVPRLEEKLNILATIAQISPLMGLLGTVAGFMEVFAVMEARGPNVPINLVSGGIWKALLATGAGLAVSIPAYVAYNYLVSRVNSIVLDMEKSSTEIVNILAENIGSISL